MTTSNGDENRYQYGRHYLRKPRTIRIIVVGAGIAGIAAVKLFKDRFGSMPMELILYEKSKDVTGTWFENRYPGCACDVPAHAYCFSWEGNPQWSRAYVGAKELFDFFKGRAQAYGVREYVRLEHRVLKAAWQDSEGTWEVEIENLRSGERLKDRGEILINAGGFLNSWKWPQIDDLNVFQGKLIHSANWDDSYSLHGKKVAVIGSGSSAIQIVPQIQPVVEHLTSLNRSPTWIISEFARKFGPHGRDSTFSEHQKNTWENDPEAYTRYRKEVESEMNRFFDGQYKHSKSQANAFEQVQELMASRLKTRPDLAKVLIPTFHVGCRRLTPGHGYLEALCSDNVTVRTEPILRAVSDGLGMSDGSHVAVDAIICATGFDTSFKPSFPVLGLDGIDLRAVWQDEPRSYLSIGAPGFPNYFSLYSPESLRKYLKLTRAVASGPNFPLANGTLIPCLEKTIAYAFDAVEKIATENIRSIVPLEDAVDDFQQHKDSLMEDLVWTSSCRSWYKNGKVHGKVWGPWCGSSLHFLELMSRPRWEDWSIRYWTGNRFQFLGAGKTLRELEGGDLAWYIQDVKM